MDVVEVPTFVIRGITPCLLSSSQGEQILSFQGKPFSYKEDKTLYSCSSETVSIILSALGTLCSFPTLFYKQQPGPDVINHFFFMLNSAKHEISPTNKSHIISDCKFLC